MSVPDIIRSRVKPLAGTLALLAALLFALLISSALGQPLVNFQSLQSMAYQLPEFGLLTIATALTMFAGGINLAVVAMANLSAIGAALLLTGTDGSAGTLLAAGIAGLLIGTFAGALNGIAVAWLRVTPVLATLCAMLIYTGLGILSTGGGAVTSLPDAVRFGANTAIFGVPLVLLLFLAASAVLAFLLHRTPFGPELRAVGFNEAAARYSGIDTRRVILATYALSGLFSALAGLVMLGRFNSAKAGYGDSYLLATILAAVLGGISPDGGKGRIVGLVLAVFVLQALASILNILNVNSYITAVVWGIVLIVKLAWDRYRQTG